mmetsp:Transcript_6482/g.19553  ORF Transcript_6482/g.19553 Transcript_6482/m.19553 type:complete len:228 (-) Transcript_6482:259-942(-)
MLGLLLRESLLPGPHVVKAKVHVLVVKHVVLVEGQAAVGKQGWILGHRSPLPAKHHLKKGRAVAAPDDHAWGGVVRRNLDLEEHLAILASDLDLVRDGRQLGLVEGRQRGQVIGEAPRRRGRLMLLKLHQALQAQAGAERVRKGAIRAREGSRGVLLLLLLLLKVGAQDALQFGLRCRPCLRLLRVRTRRGPHGTRGWSLEVCVWWVLGFATPRRGKIRKGQSDDDA